MGTPTFRVSQEPQCPRIHEKLSALAEGSRMGKMMEFGHLSLILEGMKNILLPLVPWLDKPLSPGRARGMFLFEGKYFDLALERSGNWLVKLNHPKRGVEHLQKWTRFGPFAFAERFSDPNWQNALLELALQSSTDVKNLMEEAPFLENIAVYNGVLVLLDECFKGVARTLDEREERIRIMRERLGLFKDFVDVLDPLRAEGRALPIAEHSIFDHHSHGSSRFTGGYLHERALAPFWEYLKARNVHTGSYQLQTSVFHASSLSAFLGRVRYIVSKIAEAKAKGKTEADALTGAWTSGRLPFTNEELVVLKHFASSITA